MRFNGIIPYSRAYLGSLTTTAGNETLRAKTPIGVLGAVLQRYKESAVVSTNEVWVPVGVTYIITTGITVTPVVAQLWKNGIAPNGPTSVATSGIATLAIAVSGVNELFAPFTDYTYAAATAAGDAWSLKVITTSTAGVVTANLVYATAPYLTVTDLTI